MVLQRISGRKGVLNEEVKFGLAEEKNVFADGGRKQGPRPLTPDAASRRGTRTQVPLFLCSACAAFSPRLISAVSDANHYNRSEASGMRKSPPLHCHAMPCCHEPRFWKPCTAAWSRHCTRLIFVREQILHRCRQPCRSRAAQRWSENSAASLAHN